jgi:hypothetical protein
MEEMTMNNEVMEETIATTPCEVVETNNEASNMPVYQPVQAYEPESKGPNKLIVAGLVVGGAIAVKKIANVVKTKAADKKAKKEAEEEERIMTVLKKAGLVVEPAKVEAAADVVEVKESDVVPEAKPEEPKETNKEETKK